MGFSDLVALILAVGVLLAAGAVQRRWQRLRTLSRNLLVSYATLVLILGAAEGYFRYVYMDTEGRLASNRWEDRYWRTNALGYRDRDWMPDDWAGKTTVMVVGDSIAAGWGIEDPADRFSDVLAAKLGDNYAVLNVALPGATTAQELRMLQAHPLQKPDVVILQYFLNDIEEAAISIGLGPKFPSPPRLVRESYLLNFIDARWNAGFGEGYWAWEYKAYDNPAIWAAHEKGIGTFVDYVNSTGAELIVVIFPNMQDPVRSVPYVDRVAMAFEAQGVDHILKLFDDVAAWDPATVIVSPRDGHPSAAFHHHVGQKLYDLYFAD